MKRKNEPAAAPATESTAATAIPAAAAEPVPEAPNAVVTPVAAAAAAAVARPGRARKAVKPAKAAPVAVEPAALHRADPPALTDTSARAAEPVREGHADKGKDDKPSGKAKLVRDSFTMPRADFALIAQLKDRALGFRRPAKKSELLRAGLHALAALDDAKLQAALEGLAPLKAGRPRKA